MIEDEEKPKLVGYLNRKYGYNGFEPIEAGTPVYELNNRYFFEMKITLPSHNRSLVRQWFRKDSGLLNHINIT